MDLILLSRLQFAMTVFFHFIFVPLTLGLSLLLAIMETAYVRTGDETYKRMVKFWGKLFLINFVLGVVTGITLEFQFGTNWSRFSDFAGAVTGPLLTYEVLTAFFLEAGFLGVMLFGWNRVGRGMHFFSTAMVALGTLVSTFWILASNSWMQTPQGFEIIDGRVIPVDWLAVIFNPSFPYRLAHMATAAFVATAFFVGASAAWHLLRGRNTPAIRRMLSMAMWMALVVAPLQAFIGDLHGLNT
ncbi:MAG: cytochrome ubiquinol oxidase subunit I, partial [Mailhella sp.]|nr:cytochrome ubiquinol oxidase subunit I [Mailhella sp.]